MATFYGTGTGSISSTAYNIAGTIKSISVFNKTASAAVVGIGIVVEGINIFLININLAGTGTANSSYYEETNIVVKAEWQIIVSSNQLVDYYLLIE